MADVIVQGVSYPSLAEACRAYDISYSIVWQRLQNGWDIDKAFTQTKSRTGGRAVIVNGISYPSIRQAAIANGIPYQTMRKRIETGKQRTVIYKGSTYSSRKEIAELFSVNYNIVNQRVFKGWSLEKAVSTPVVANSYPVVVKGISYPSRRAAARAYNIPYHIVRYRLNKGKNIEEAFNIRGGYE